MLPAPEGFRPNGPPEHSPGLRPQVDALGVERHRTVRPEGGARIGVRKTNAGSHDGFYCVSSAPSGRTRVILVPPRASACGLSPGLGSVGPLGRAGFAYKGSLGVPLPARPSVRYA